MKRDKYDEVFSDCVRQAADWTCERCGKVDADGQAYGKSRSTHCSHIFGRRNLATRWHPHNGVCLCAACHKELGDDPIEHAAFAKKRLGEANYNELIRQARSVWKWTKADKAEMYQHYRSELKRLKAQVGPDRLVGYQ